MNGKLVESRTEERTHKEGRWWSYDETVSTEKGQEEETPPWTSRWEKTISFEILGGLMFGITYGRTKYRRPEKGLEA